ncbi:MAG: hypothetical protein F6K19_09125 [Cyanothece sp. SIO1E1]|nr:hypothetical protein [Cyanothece sp. SIO1E1]
MIAKVNSLESIVQQIGEAVLATTETVERLSERVDSLANQVQQQGYQIFALSDAIQTLGENHDDVLENLMQMTEYLRRLVESMEESDPPQV